MAWAAPSKPAGDGSLSIAAESVRLDLQLDSAGAFKLVGLNAFGSEWGVPGSGALWIEGLQADGGPLSLDGGGGLEPVEQTATGITLAHPATGLRIGLEYRAGPGSAITFRAILSNGRDGGAIRVGSASTLALRLARGDRALALATDDAPEGWSTVSRPLPAGFGNDGLRSGDGGVYPLVRLEADGGDGLVLAVSTATAWKVDLGLEGGARVARAGEYSGDLTLRPGEEARLPDVVTIFYRGGESGAIAALRGYLEGVSAPPPDGWTVPPAVFNTWFGYGTALLDTGADGELRRAARLAAEAGVEVFVLDAGWYLGSPVQDETAARNARRACAEGEAAECSTLDDFSRGLGTWVEEPSKWQGRGGLRGFADFVRGLDVKRPDGSAAGKLRFGLWVEAERFDPVFDRPERVPGSWAIPGTAVLDFSRPEVVDGITARIQQAIGAYGVEYLKIDANQVVGAADGRSGHFWTRWSQGFERMIESLRTANPRLYLEHCASGLKRYWIGVPRLYHGSWLDDDVGFNTVGHLLDATDLLLLPRQKIVLATEDLTRYEQDPDDEHGEDTATEAIDQMKRIIAAYWGHGNGGTIGFSSRIDRWQSRDSQPWQAASAALATWKQTVRR